MSRSRRQQPDDEDDDWSPDDEDDLPDGVYPDDEDDDPDGYTVACPHCREPVHEDAQFCPRCENYISREDAPAAGKPMWVWVCLALALGCAALWAMTPG